MEVESTRLLPHDGARGVHFEPGDPPPLQGRKVLVGLEPRASLRVLRALRYALGWNTTAFQAFADGAIVIQRVARRASGRLRSAVGWDLTAFQRLQLHDE